MFIDQYGWWIQIGRSNDPQPLKDYIQLPGADRISSGLFYIYYHGHDVAHLVRTLKLKADQTTRDTQLAMYLYPPQEFIVPYAEASLPISVSVQAAIATCLERLQDNHPIQDPKIQKFIQQHARRVIWT